MSALPNRKDVPDARKWAVEDIINESDFSSVKENVRRLLQDVLTYRGKLNKDNTAECLKKDDELTWLLEKMYVFASMKSDEDKSNTRYSGLEEEISMLYTECATQTSFITPELSLFSDADLRDMESNPNYADFSMYLHEILRSKEHLLSREEEAIVASVGSFAGDFQTVFSMFDNVNVPFGKVTYEGEKVKLSHGLYSVLMNGRDRKARKKAYETMYKGYISMIDTVAATYAGSVKKDCWSAKVKKFSSRLEQSLFADDIHPKVYDNLIESVREYTPLMHEYMKYRAKCLGLKKLAMYDVYVPIAECDDGLTDYDTAFDMVCDALKPLGEEYLSVFRKAKEEGWIDVEETANKRSGAYSTGVYGTHPYVLLNHRGTIHDIFTVAHEMGHAMHTYYSSTAQCHAKADYTIFVAEIASTVNEVLMIKHMLKTAEGERRKYLLSYFIDMIRTTLFRQTMFSEFEKFAHETVENGESLGYEKMNEYYAELNRKYYGDGVVTDKYIAYEWARIPHFYTSFYVYKYATGITCAINIADMILKNPEKAKDYKRFLQSGGSLYPSETLALVGIDLTEKAPYTVAMEEFAEALHELEKM